MKSKKRYNELICRTETDSQTFKNLWLPKGAGLGKVDWAFEESRLGVWDLHMHTKVYGMIGQWETSI